MGIIKEQREKIGLTQKQLAEMLGIRQSTVAMWETEINKPRADKLLELAKILGCTVDELLKNIETTS